MVNASYAARRAAEGIDRDFPAQPTLPLGATCNGLAFVGQATPSPELRSLREHITGLWHGQIGPQPGAPSILLVTFDRAISVDGEIWPAAMPLTAADGFAWRSFVASADNRRPGPAMADATPRWIDLWWDGGRHRVPVDSLNPLSIVDLWDPPVVTVHQPAPRGRPSIAGGAQRGGTTSRAGEGGDEEADRRSPVSTASIPIESLARSPLGDMTDALGERGAPRGFFGLFASLFGAARSGSEAAASASRGGSGGMPRTPRGPGTLANLLGWLKWHSPLGSDVQRQYNGRLGQVEKLIASGDIDAALKLALRLGSGKGDGLPKRYPNRLPPGRATLDFDLASSGFSMPILDAQAFVSLQWRYRELASKLETDGDFRRAAYIFSQLLGDHARAVEVLEKGEFFIEAARLALDARLEPAIAITMFYKAGELDTALALAKRTGCFDRLAEHSLDKGGVYHAYVMKAWTDMLVATGQQRRAMQVTDSLAADAAADPALLAERRRWLSDALNDASSSALDAELIARAVLTARWGGDLSLDAIEDFPRMTAIQGERAFVMALDQMQSLMRGDDDHAGDTLIDVLMAFARLAVPISPEQVTFWGDPAALIIERFARTLIELASSGLTQSDLQTLHALLDMAKLPVLATDLGKLRKLYAASRPTPGVWRVPPATSMREPVCHACLFADGMVLAWRGGDRFELFDRNGASLWTRTASNVLGLVAVGTSPDAIVIQAERDGTCTLSRFSSQRRSFTSLGTIDLLAWHDITSESQWLVQIGGTIGALDLVKLCGAMPEFAFHWSCALTERLRVLSFADFPNAPSWITCDISPKRAGLLERWSLQSLATLTTQLCVPPHSLDDPATLLPTDWHWDQGLMGATDDAKRWMQVRDWSLPGEQTALQFYAARLAAGIAAVDTFQPRDRGRSFVSRSSGEAGETRLSVATAAASPPVARLVYFEDNPLRCLARQSACAHSGSGKSPGVDGVVLLADASGRLFKVSVAVARVTVF